MSGRALFSNSWRSKAAQVRTWAAHLAKFPPTLYFLQSCPRARMQVNLRQTGGEDQYWDTINDPWEKTKGMPLEERRNSEKDLETAEAGKSAVYSKEWETMSHTSESVGLAGRLLESLACICLFILDRIDKERELRGGGIPAGLSCHTSWKLLIPLYTSGAPRAQGGHSHILTLLDPLMHT